MPRTYSPKCRPVSKHPLAIYLADNHLTQAELARKSGVHKNILNDVLHGKRGGRFSGPTALRIWEACGRAVPLDQLLRSM